MLRLGFHAHTFHRTDGGVNALEVLVNRLQGNGIIPRRIRLSEIGIPQTEDDGLPLQRLYLKGAPCRIPGLSRELRRSWLKKY